MLAWHYEKFSRDPSYMKYLFHGCTIQQLNMTILVGLTNLDRSFTLITGLHDFKLKGMDRRRLSHHRGVLIIHSVTKPTRTPFKYSLIIEALTMTEQDNFFPSKEFYSLGSIKDVKQRRLPYAGSDLGMGIQLPDNKPVTKVYANGQNAAARFNEPENFYGQRILAKTMDLMTARSKKTIAELQTESPGKKINRVGEREFMDKVFKEESELLNSQAGYDPESLESMTNRRLTVMWNIMSGFNTDHDGNLVLDEITLTYAKVRAGEIGLHQDEMGAAVYAVQKYFRRVIKDCKDEGTGMWTLPAVHLLNGHLIHRGLTALAFHPVMEHDDLIRDEQRKVNSEVKWISSDGEGLNKRAVYVESRDSVREELIHYALVRHNHQLEFVEGEAPPTEALLEDGRPRKFRKFEFS